ncbi:MAG: hypothetical protein DDG60_07240 [Anaerolineae bacterium]|nr:MAG: hypothetical protein DDG60_07240 [Anaerolineae bacterium]
MYLLSEISLFPFLLLLALWSAGGWFMLARFELPAHERGLLGLGVGLTLAALLANLTARLLPTVAAFWLAAVLTLAIGVALAWPFAWSFKRSAVRTILSHLMLWLLLALLTFFLTLIGRGLGIFDDYQNLTQLSSMALGDIPPHFVYDPRLLWSYHYFLLLVAAQLMRLAEAPPWTAMDVARGLTLALTLVYGAFLAWRLTKSQVAAALSAAFLFFAGGARWMLLLLPASLLQSISASVTLIGSGADTGPNLMAALYNNWKIQGLGPFPFPFLYGSGLDPSLTMAHAGYGASMFMLVLLIILLSTAPVAKSHPSVGYGVQQAILAVLLAALALANEVTFAFLYAGIIFAAVFWMLHQRTLHLPRSLWAFAPAILSGGVLALLQGGVFTGVLLGFLGRWSGSAAGEALYKVSFTIRPPAVLSAHVGTLSLSNPLHWLVILAETGLVVVVLPWVFWRGWKCLREERWLEAAWVFSMIPSLLTIFVEYTGNAGPTALSRMTAHFLMVLKFYAVPLLWVWLKEKADTWQVAFLGWGLAACLSGLGLLTLQIPAMPNPIYAEFLDPLDAKMYDKHWGTLQAGALVFDTSPQRGPTVLGLHTRSGIHYGPPTFPEWYALKENPDPFAMKRAGFRYLYLERAYWQKFADHFTHPCVKILDDMQDLAADGRVLAQRVLLDVEACYP